MLAIRSRSPGSRFTAGMLLGACPCPGGHLGISAPGMSAPGSGGLDDAAQILMIYWAGNHTLRTRAQLCDVSLIGFGAGRTLPSPRYAAKLSRS